MATKHHTKADKAWFEAITGIGCVACQNVPDTGCVTALPSVISTRDEFIRGAPTLPSDTAGGVVS